MRAGNRLLACAAAAALSLALSSCESPPENAGTVYASEILSNYTVICRAEYAGSGGVVARGDGFTEIYGTELDFNAYYLEQFFSVTESSDPNAENETITVLEYIGFGKDADVKNSAVSKGEYVLFLRCTDYEYYLSDPASQLHEMKRKGMRWNRSVIDDVFGPSGYIAFPELLSRFCDAHGDISPASQDGCCSASEVTEGDIITYGSELYTERAVDFMDRLLNGKPAIMRSVDRSHEGGLYTNDCVLEWRLNEPYIIARYYCNSLSVQDEIMREAVGLRVERVFDSSRLSASISDGYFILQATMPASEDTAVFRISAENSEVTETLAHLDMAQAGGRTLELIDGLLEIYG